MVKVKVDIPKGATVEEMIFYELGYTARDIRQRWKEYKMQFRKPPISFQEFKRRFIKRVLEECGVEV